MATLSLSDLDSLPPAGPRGNMLSLDDLANLDPKQPPAEAGPMSWSDVASGAVNNIGPSAYNVGASLVHTIAHPIQTAEGLYDVGKGAVSKAAGALGVEQDPETKAQNEAAINAVGQFFADRYGGIENFKKTLAEDPAGFAMDLSTVLTGGEGVLARIPGATRATNTVRQAARISNPVTLAGKTVSKVAEPLVTNLGIGISTGVGAAPIRQAVRSGFQGNRIFIDNMRGRAPMTDAIDMAQSAVGQMGAERGAAYRANMAAANKAPGHVGYQPIHQAITDADKMVNFQGLAKSAEAAKTLEQIQDLVSQWRGISTPHTVEAADALKQAIGEIRQKTQPGTLERRVADSVYNAAKSSIVQQAPGYAKAMNDYAVASDKINDLTKTFSLGEKASQDTALRKLQSVTRDNVNTNYGQRTKLMDELAKYEPDLPHALAGQAMSTVAPRGLVARLGAGGVGTHSLLTGGVGGALANPLGLLATAATLPFFSPRIVGEAAYAGGRVARGLRPFTEVLPGATKGGYVGGILSGGIGPRYDENGNLLQ